MFPMSASILFVVSAQAAATAPAAAAAVPRMDIRAVVERVQKRYDTAQDFRAVFSQTLTNVAYNRTSSSSGEVLLKKPGRMRWNYDKPEKKMYLADGELLWLYEPEDKQAFKQSLKGSQLPAALAFLTGKGKLSDEFEVTFATAGGHGTPGDYVLSLRPKQPQGQVKAILFVVDSREFHVRESVVVDAQGNTNNLVFSDVKVNTKIPDSIFRWTPPAGVRVVDTAKLGQAPK